MDKDIQQNKLHYLKHKHYSHINKECNQYIDKHYPPSDYAKLADFIINGK